MSHLDGLWPITRQATSSHPSCDPTLLARGQAGNLEKIASAMQSTQNICRRQAVAPPRRRADKTHVPSAVNQAFPFARCTVSNSSAKKPSLSLPLVKAQPVQIMSCDHDCDFSSENFDSGQSPRPDREPKHSNEFDGVDAMVVDEIEPERESASPSPYTLDSELSTVSDNFDFEVTEEEVCLLYLRQAFIDAQAALSYYVAEMFKRCYGAALTPDDGQPMWFFEFCRLFPGDKMSKYFTVDGPWDIYSLCVAMMEGFEKVVMTTLELRDISKDSTKTQLFSCIRKIFVTRNWWSHGSGLVTIPECVRAMKSLIDLIGIVCRLDISGQSCADSSIERIQWHIAIVESSRLSLSAEFSVPFHTCIVFMRALDQLRIFACSTLFHQQQHVAADKKSRTKAASTAASGGDSTPKVAIFTHDSDFADIIDAIKPFASNLHFVCDMLKKGRNYFFHGTDSNQTFLLLMCSFAVAPLLKTLYTSSSAKQLVYVPDGTCEPADTCHASAMQLMIRMGIADGKVLLTRIMTSLSEQPSVCPYIGCMNGLPDIMRLRHLVSRSVPISHSPFGITIKNDFKKDTFIVKKLLDIVKFFPEIQPHGEPSSNSDAASWLSMENNAENLKKLIEFAEFRNPVASEADIFLLFSAIKSKLSMMCDGIPDHFSGWEMLHHMLPMLSDLKRSKSFLWVDKVPCLCSATMSEHCSFDERSNQEIMNRLIMEKNLPATDDMSDLDLNFDIDPAWAVAFCSPAIQSEVNSRPAVRVSITFSTSLSMRAAIERDLDFIGRQEEMEAISSSVEQVISCTSQRNKRLLLFVVGAPGLGKSCLATQAIRDAQKRISEKRIAHNAKIEVIRGRGANIVDAEFVDLGHNLGREIDVFSASKPEEVLAALQRFLRTSPYVLLIDDADFEGLHRALEFLPVSNQCCSVIVTSQSLTKEDVQKLQDADDSSTIQFYKELEPFSYEECLRLMKKICSNCAALLQSDLSGVFVKLGHLPLGIALFAKWSRSQFWTSMKPHEKDRKEQFLAAQEQAAKENRPFENEQFEAKFLGAIRAAEELLQRWNDEHRVVLEGDAKYSRGLLATVRLALRYLESFPENYQAAIKQLLGLLSICPSKKVPWSLFDGGINNEAQLLVRGARVLVQGISLDVISPVGERFRLKTSDFPHPDATVLSDLTTRIGSMNTIEIVRDGHDKSYAESVSNIDFSPHLEDLQASGTLNLRLRSILPGKGVKVVLKNPSDRKLKGKHGVIKSHVCLDTASVGVPKGWNDRTVGVHVEGYPKVLEMRIGCLDLPPNVTFKHDQLFFQPEEPALSVEFKTKTSGRVLQHNAENRTVSVIFGCDTGELSNLKPGSQVHRFKECDVHIAPAVGVHELLQEVDGLNCIAQMLKESGLVRVDADDRMFHMHQLLQEAVGIELDRPKHLPVMQELLHLRCGQFGDEPLFDHRLFGVMREILVPAFDIVRSMQIIDWELCNTWSSGMLIRLFDLSRSIHGIDKTESRDILSALHSSLVAELVYERARSHGSTKTGRCMVLQDLVDSSPEILETVTSLGLKIELTKLLANRWSVTAHKALVLHIVCTLVNDTGKRHTQGKVLPYAKISQIELIKDIARLRYDFDLFKCLQNECANGKGWTISDDSKEFIFNKDIARVSCTDLSEANKSDLAYVKDLRLRAMRWYFHTLHGHTDTIDEIQCEYDEEGGDALNWSVKVAFGAALHAAGTAGTHKSSNAHALRKQAALLERAICIRLDTLGELHPLTASSFKFLGKNYFHQGQYESAVVFLERAMRIDTEILGLHSATAVIMSDLGECYRCMKPHRIPRAIQLYQEALSIHTNTVGRIHPYSADVMFNMSLAYGFLGQHDQAFDFAQMAMDIREKCFGAFHKKTQLARDLVRELRPRMPFLISEVTSRRQPNHKIISPTCKPVHAPSLSFPSSTSRGQILEVTFKKSRARTSASMAALGTFVYFPDSTYQGEWTYDTSRKFVGCSESGAPHGHGVMSYNNGHIYAGLWKDGLKHGTGKYVFCDQMTYYEGHFRNGLPHGQGVHSYSNGQVYDGAWVKGKKHGVGKMTYPSGGTFEGHWIDDERSFGKLVIRNGVYEGEFEHNLASGRGVFTQIVDGHAFGSKYEGHKGDKYEGQWSGHCRNGEGKCTLGLNGHESMFQWKEGICRDFELWRKTELKALRHSSEEVVPTFNHFEGSGSELSSSEDGEHDASEHQNAVFSSFAAAAVSQHKFRSKRFVKLMNAAFSLLAERGSTSSESQYLLKHFFDAAVDPNLRHLMLDDPKIRLVDVFSAYPDMFQLHNIDMPGMESVHAIQHFSFSGMPGMESVLLFSLSGEIDTGSSAVPGNFFDEKNAMISCFHVSSILGLGPGTPDHARTMVSYKFRLASDYYPENLAQIRESGAESVFRGWMRTLFQRDRIVNWMTPIFGDRFYAPADSMTGVFHIDLSEDMGLNARLHGVSMNCECVVNVDTSVNGTLNGTQKQMIEVKMMSMMAVWRAKRSICYMPRASTKVLRFDFDQQKWLAIFRCLCNWAKTAYDPANPNYK
jgi:tetratricopeptide (TPR) repeat protein